MRRRQLLKATLAGASLLPLRASAARHPLPGEADDPGGALAALERRHGGRLGVAILDTGSGRRLSHRGHERFLLCSTFKVLAVAAVLDRVARGEESLDRRVVFRREAVLAYAPVTRLHVGAPGMRVAGLCAAAIEVSDNTAANLLLDSLGGPAAVTAFVRRLGDPVTRLDRTEPTLNVGAPGDLRDTTTPDACLATLGRIALGGALDPGARERLLAWMSGCITGTDKLRAGLPHAWRVADKTGSGAHGESNDVAVVFPPDRPPLLIAAFYAAPAADALTRSAVLAEVGRLAATV